MAYAKALELRMPDGHLTSLVSKCFIIINLINWLDIKVTG
jgi:hypothetical protein